MTFPRGAFALCLLFVPLTVAPAAPVVVEAGQTHTLAEDLLLAGADTLEIRGTAEKPCTLVGGRYRIRSETGWTGTVKIAHCTIKDLGGLQKRSDSTGLFIGNGLPALDLKVGGKGDVTVENCTFDACSAIHLQTDDKSTARFRNNTIPDSSVVAITKNVEHSGDAFLATGNSREKKLFQGNSFARGKVVFRAPNWLVGGDSDADANLF